MKNTIILLLVPPKFVISIVFNFAWDLNQVGAGEMKSARRTAGKKREQLSLDSHRPVAFSSFGLLLQAAAVRKEGLSPIGLNEIPWLCFCRDSAVADLTK